MSTDANGGYFDDVAPDVFVEFQAFEAANPHIFECLYDLAMQLVQSGRQRYGMKSLWEVLRYHTTVTSGDDNYKLNNNYTAYYARLLMTVEPAFAGLFATRVCRRTLRGCDEDGN